MTLPPKNIPPFQQRRRKSTDPRRTLPLGLIGIVLAVLSREDVLPFIAEPAQCYILGAAAVAALIGGVDLWEQSRDVTRYGRK